MSNDDLKVLQSRIEEIKQRPTLPIIMVDSMLPGQRLVFRANNEELADLAEEGLVGVLGQPSRRPTPAVVGVTAKLTSRGLYEWELKAERVFQVISQPDAGPAWAELEVLAKELEGKITRAKVEFLDEPDDIQLAEAIPVLVDEWQQALLEHKAERYEGQLKDILKETTKSETRSAMLWVSEMQKNLPRAISVLSHLTIFPRVARSPTWRATLGVSAVLLLWRQGSVSTARAARGMLQATTGKHRKVAGALEQRLDDLLLGREARAESMRQGCRMCSENPFSAFAGGGSKKDEEKKKKKGESKRKSVSKRDLNAKQIVEHWSQYAHPRAKEFFTTPQQLEEVLVQLAKGTDKSDDPITGPDEKCVYWYGDVTKDDLQAAIRMVKPGEQAESVTYVNRVLAFIFATDDSFEKLMALPKEPFKMSCGDQLCVHLAHISLATA
eukprot:g18262.t1